MAMQMDLDHKPTPAEWLAGDAWFDGLMRGVVAAYREGYSQSREETERRLGGSKQGRGEAR